MNTIQEPTSTMSETEIRESAEAAYEGTRDGVKAVGRQARENARAYADAQKRQVSDSLDQFAKAIERAGDELQQRDQSMAGQLVREAAGSLGEFSRSIGGSSTSEIVDSVRDFGRRNPAAFIGGAVLAGLALGRFARSAPRDPDGRPYAPGSGPHADTSATPSYPGAGPVSDGGTP